MKLSNKAVLIILILSLVIIVAYSFREQPEASWTNPDGSTITCRYPGCSSSPVYPDYNRRFCSQHITDTHYCKYPNCMNPVPNSSEEQYCSEHD